MTENKTENMPDFPNVLRNLFEQVRTQAESHRRRVRIQEEKSESKEERKESENSESSEDSDDHDGHHHKWDIMLDLADSHRMLCRAFVELLNNRDE